MRAWADAGMGFDSTLSYADSLAFDVAPVMSIQRFTQLLASS
jgi:hypothetical protein